METPGLSADAVSKYSLSDDIAWQPHSIVSKQIIKKPNGNVTLFAFDAGESLSEHTTPYDALVFIVDGTMDITVGGILHQVTKGEYMLMPAGIPHGLVATVQAKMLLTMIK